MNKTTFYSRITVIMVAVLFLLSHSAFETKAATTFDNGIAFEEQENELHAEPQSTEVYVNTPFRVTATYENPVYFRFVPETSEKYFFRILNVYSYDQDYPWFDIYYGFNTEGEPDRTLSVTSPCWELIQNGGLTAGQEYCFAIIPDHNSTGVDIEFEIINTQEVYADVPFRVSVGYSYQNYFKFTPEISGVYCVSVGNVYAYDAIEDNIWIGKDSEGIWADIRRVSSSPTEVFGFLTAGIEYSFKAGAYYTSDNSYYDLDVTISLFETDILTDVPRRVVVDQTHPMVLKFVPEETGVYYLTIPEIYGWSEESGLDVEYDFDTFMNIYQSDYDNISIGKIWEAGTTHYLEIALNNNEICNESFDFDLVISKRPFEITEVTIDDITTYYGADYDSWNLDYDPYTNDWQFNDWRLTVWDNMVHVTTDEFNGTLQEFCSYYNYDCVYRVQEPDQYLPDNTYEVVLTVDEVEVTFNLTVLSSPITSVSVDKVTAYDGVLDFNTGSQVCWDYDLDDSIEIQTYYYNCYYMTGYLGIDIPLTVIADGKTYNGNLDEVQEQLQADYGCWFGFFMFPRTEELSVGNNDVKWALGGVETTGIIEIQINPVVSIDEITSFNIYKDDYRLINGIKYYDFEPLTITVETVDGQVTGDFYYVDEALQDKYGFGISIRPDVYQDENQWQVDEVHTITVSIGNISTSYRVKILNQSYIFSVKVDDVMIDESDISHSYYEWWNELANEYEWDEYELYYPNNLTLTVRTRDGEFSGTDHEVYSQLSQKMRRPYLWLSDDIYDDQWINGPWAVGTTHNCSYRMGDIEGTFNITIVSGNRPMIMDYYQSTGGITLSWSDMEATKYELYRSDNSEPITTTRTSYTDPVGRTMGQEYTYRVRGYVGGKWTEFSEDLTVIFNPFIDVEEGTESFNHIAWAYNNGIVNGISGYDNIFSPEGDCERMNFCIMLWKMVGKPKPGKKTPFKDLKGLSANNVNAITWCYNQKIVAGFTKTTFKPHNNITRAQLAIMIWKFAGKPPVDGMDCPYTDIEVTKTFTANNRKAVIWCYNYGIINSITGDKFDPDLNGTRALLAEMLYGYNEIYHIVK